MYTVLKDSFCSSLLAQDTPTTRPAAVTQRMQVKDPERPEPKTSENRSCGGYPRAKCGKKKREKIEMAGNSMELMREISLMKLADVSCSKVMKETG